MRTLPIIVAAVLAFWSAAALAQMGDPEQMRQKLASLNTEIEQLDAKLADIGRKRTELEVTVDTFGKAVEASKAANQRVREEDEKLAVQRREVETEQHAATELCSRKVPEAQYKALVAQCEAAGAAYQQREAALKQEYEKALQAHAKYKTDAQRLETERKELEQRREGVQQTQSSLHADRERLVHEFNELRDRLIAAQSDALPKQN
jgi:chromosome segregation ATPase